MKRIVLALGISAAAAAHAEDSRKIGAWNYLPDQQGEIWETMASEIPACTGALDPSAVFAFTCEKGDLNVVISTNCKIPASIGDRIPVTIGSDNLSKKRQYNMTITAENTFTSGGGFGQLIAQRLATTHYAHVSVGGAEMTFNFYGLDRVILETDNSCLHFY
ncbi:hypothetical protein KM176_16615 [Pseudooceanicola sp. CBS1P-1]|uniref:Uncharacterized protein n=1 Tax=Pseudooceanicola albus TaxID=2692189 RepID=A0A6L7G5D1_9RHOB|nr:MULTISPECIES: hypothetical protein [Pseudooceanicola]MBT9385499.1 hypothetical protein [Pseudooceanicola endophyticus]MXN19089.1 hypothetical protein [Pseudooceanicola albus]